MEKEYKYMVCTRCMTYNHASFIEETLKGFCMQETNFPVVYCVMDDASTDGAQEVIRGFVENNFIINDSTHKETNDYEMIFSQHKNNPNCYFVVFFLKTNHYSTPELRNKKKEYISEWHNSSKYIAICEGDDCWIEKTKLQQQVEIMEKNPNIGLCYTRAYVYIQRRNRLIKPQTVFSYKGLRELIHINPVMTLTTLFRKDLYDQYLEEINPSIQGWRMGDYPIWIWMAANTEVCHLDIYTAKYRQLDNSASHSQDLDKQINFLKSINDVQHFFINRYLPKDEDIKIKVDDRTNARIAAVYDAHGSKKKYMEYAKKVHVKNRKLKRRILLYSIPCYYACLRLVRMLRKKIASYVFAR